MKVHYLEIVTSDREASHNLSRLLDKPGFNARVFRTLHGNISLTVTAFCGQFNPGN